jgi:probable rRNA maturation factor
MRALSNSKVYFFYEIPVSLPGRTRLKQFIADLFKAEGYKLDSLNYIFCSDKYLLNINRQYLAHDYYTDIITFELSTEDRPVQGEVYISIERVKENARIHESSRLVELYRIIFHGALHLCGYSDKTKSQKATMRAKEDEYLRKYLKRST